MSDLISVFGLTGFETQLDKMIDRKARDALGAQYAEKIGSTIIQQITAKLTHAPSAAELAAMTASEMNEFAQPRLPTSKRATARTSPAPGLPTTIRVTPSRVKPTCWPAWAAPFPRT